MNVSEFSRMFTVSLCLYKWDIFSNKRKKSYPLMMQMNLTYVSQINVNQTMCRFNVNTSSLALAVALCLIILPDSNTVLLSFLNAI